MIENFSSLQKIIGEIPDNKLIGKNLRLLISIRILKNTTMNSIEKHFRNNFLSKTLKIKNVDDIDFFLNKSKDNLKKIIYKKDINREFSKIKKNKLINKIYYKLKNSKKKFYENSSFEHSLIEALDKYIIILLEKIISKKNSKITNLPEFYGILKNLNGYEKKFKKNGYLVIKNFFKKSDIDKISSALSKIEYKELKNNTAYFYGKNNKSRRSYNLIGKNILFSKLILDNHFINNLMFRLFNRNTYHDKFYLSSLQSNLLYPGAEKQHWHIDSNLPEPIPKWLTRVQVAIAIDNFTSINGSTELGINTHIKPKHPLNKEPRKKKKILCKKGSLIIWSGNLWHRSSANNSKKIRKAILCCFSSSVLKYISSEDNHLRLISKSQISKLSENSKKLIGYYQGVSN